MDFPACSLLRNEQAFHTLNEQPLKYRKLNKNLILN